METETDSEFSKRISKIVVGQPIILCREFLFNLGLEADLDERDRVIGVRMPCESDNYRPKDFRPISSRPRKRDIEIRQVSGGLALHFRLKNENQDLNEFIKINCPPHLLRRTKYITKLMLRELSMLLNSDRRWETKQIEIKTLKKSISEEERKKILEEAYEIRAELSRGVRRSRSKILRDRIYSAYKFHAESLADLISALSPSI